MQIAYSADMFSKKKIYMNLSLLWQFFWIFEAFNKHVLFYDETCIGWILRENIISINSYRKPCSETSVIPARLNEPQTGTQDLLFPGDLCIQASEWVLVKRLLSHKVVKGKLLSHSLIGSFPQIGHLNPPPPRLGATDQVQNCGKIKGKMTT